MADKEKKEPKGDRNKDTIKTPKSIRKERKGPTRDSLRRAKLEGKGKSVTREELRRAKVGGAEEIGEGERAGGKAFFFQRRYNHVRYEIARNLVEKYNYDWRTAREKAEEVTNEDIDERAAAMKTPFSVWTEEEKARIGDDRTGALGDGTFLRWLIEHKEQILQLIMAIVSILAMFASDGPAPAPEEPTKPDDKKPEPAPEPKPVNPDGGGGKKPKPTPPSPTP